MKRTLLALVALSCVTALAVRPAVAERPASFGGSQPDQGLMAITGEVNEIAGGYRSFALDSRRGKIEVTLNRRTVVRMHGESMVVTDLRPGAKITVVGKPDKARRALQAAVIELIAH